MPTDFPPTGSPDPTGETTSGSIVIQRPTAITVPQWIWLLLAGSGGSIMGAGGGFLTAGERLQALEMRIAVLEVKLDQISDNVREIKDERRGE